MLSVPDHPLRLNVFLYIPQSPLTSVRSAVQFKLLPWLFLLQEDRNGLPGCMERIQLLLGVSSQKPKRNWLMIDLSRKNKKTGNDRQLFSPCAHQLCILTSKCKNRYILLCTLYPIYLYMYSSMYICAGALLKHIVRV